MKKYIGPNEVEDIYSTEHKTPSGKEVLRITYVGDVKDELMSRLMFDKVVSKEATDLSLLREDRLIPIAEDMLKVMTEWGVKLDEVPYLIQQKILKSIEDSTDKAHSKLFEFELETASSEFDITLLHYDIVLNYNKEE